MNPATLSSLGAASAAVLLGAGTCAYGAMYSQSQLFGPTLRRTSTPKHFALTFDDGPNPAATPRILDLLDRFQARATFFVIGNYVRVCPDLVRETIARGHQVGNHTQTHPNLFWLSPARLTQELESCQSAIVAATQQTPRWMRPPFGLRSPLLDRIARRLGLRGVVMWSEIPGDWKPKTTQWLIARMRPIAIRAERCVAAANRGGDILALHDGDHRFFNSDRERTVAALEYWLPRWRDLGLEFVTIEEAASR